MVQGKGSQESLAFGQKRDEYLAPVLLGPASSDQTGALQAIDQLDGAVMLQLHLLRESANSGAQVRWKSLDGKEKLVLLGLKSGIARGHFAEMQEAPDLISKLSQGAIIELLVGLHIYIVTR